MARKAIPAIDEKALTKGELRKLNALRNSVGDQIGEQTFKVWLAAKTNTGPAAAVDKNAALIASTLQPLAEAGKLKIPRGGYLVRRGRGRVIVTMGR